MTDSVSGISGVKEAGRNSSPGGGVFKKGKGAGHRKEPEEDRIDISREASEKALEEKAGNGP
ncbi:hypothetical protein F6V30_04800 [Oryzomonas sagensis]|uniref:Uncharacterized protein n=1 Tax=Oryzomonas sagensis TaxID=2603857 RepID=A0ABQ6TSF1_9BACT|nr:hypothetical protein [Oryzomonas sagensis]KAB0671902.1 hypothetical protein F6V30_04800 [Oryzomonas sagensis]